MPRYILIDNNSGYIWGDTADYAAGRQDDIHSISDAARMLDESLGVHGQVYRELARDPRTTKSGYNVYRADVGGSEAVAVVLDGQDKETIEAVQRDCQYVGFVEGDDEELPPPVAP